MEFSMTDPDTVFDAMATPVYAGIAIILLISVRQLEFWKVKRLVRAKPAGPQSAPCARW
jgi:hypothetical protein